MGFMKPKTPKAPTPANVPVLAKDVESPLPDSPYGWGSLISTSPSGLKRKASTQRTSLIGG
jgi:hypothetical protein